MRFKHSNVCLNSIIQGFGLSDFNSNASTNLSNQNLIKRYNYYSIRILSAMQENACVTKQINAVKTDEIEPSAVKKRRLNDEIDDLLVNDANTTSCLKGKPLNLIHTERYFNGPSDKPDSNMTSQQNISGNVESCRRMLDKMQNWNFNLNVRCFSYS